MSEWDGRERRKHVSNVELLIRIDEKLTAHIERVEERFVYYDSNISSMRSQIGWLQKGAFMLLGAFALIDMLSKFYK